jgi:hypothetical protein
VRDYDTFAMFAAFYGPEKAAGVQASLGRLLRGAAALLRDVQTAW